MSPRTATCCGGRSSELLLSELERPFGMFASELQLAAMEGDDRDREVILRHFEPVLDRDVSGACGVLGRERPVSSPEFDPRETPERAGAPRLVALAPRFVLALEQRAGLLPLRERGEGVHNRQGRLHHELLAAHGAREVAGEYG